MPTLVAEDEESVSSSSPNEGEDSVHEAFQNLEHVTHRRSDHIRDNQKMSGSPTLASVAHKLSYAADFMSFMQSNKTYALREVQKEPDFKEFKVMEKEIKDHYTSDRWEIVHKSEARGRKVLKATWAFKRKRNPDGSLDTHKARIIPHGGMKRWGVDYWETHSPVASWLTIRLMFLCCVMCNLASMSLDFARAFPQADLKKDVFMEIPFGYDNPSGDYVLRLKKNFYGLCDGNLT